MNTPPPPPLPPPPSLALDDRGREIFREIVDAYLKTGDPVGSRTLSKLGASGLSAASIRNTMADLAALGLLDAPHAMAGRRPTQAGLRFFLDTLLQVSNDPPEEDQAEIEARIAKAGRGREEVLAAASDLLSGLAGGAGLVVTAQREAPVRHFEFVSLSPSQALAVFVFEDNTVENRLVELPVGLTPSALTQASNFLNAHLKGRTLAEARQEAGEALQAEKTRLDELAAKLVSTGLVEWGGEDPLQGRALIVRGRAKLLSDARAQEDLSRITQLFEDLEQAQNLVQILDLARSAESVRIFLGSENPIFSLTGSSTIVKPYLNAQRQVVGALGVIGPTRLNYARIIPVVDYTARVVSRVLDPERS